jgi:hypothetical protein
MKKHAIITAGRPLAKSEYKLNDLILLCIRFPSKINLPGLLPTGLPKVKSSY